MRARNEIERIAKEIRLNTELSILADDRERTIDKIRDYARKPGGQLVSPAVIGEILRSYDHRAKMIRTQLDCLKLQKSLDEYRQKVEERS